MFKAFLVAAILVIPALPPAPSGGGFSPDDITGLTWWFESDDSTYVFENTGCSTAISTDVQCWEDQGSAGEDLTEGTAPPAWGNPGVDHDSSSSEFLSATTTQSFDELHLFFVFERAANVNVGRLFSAAPTGTNDSFDGNGISIREQNTGGGLLVEHNLFGGRELTASLTSTLSASTVYLVEVYIDFTSNPATLDVRLDGTSEGTDSASGTFSAWDPDVIALSVETPGLTSRFTDNTYYAVLGYNAEVTGSNLTDLRDYLDDTYTIPGL